ncbi:HNH endonuclease [Pseudomonas laurylsulfatiphila]|uniref:HNH endonuclease n=1 Tax=Pseudomonas laurylsulfatiphila TaxID=2011015 RepID=UPI00215EC5D1|nr:HNH endonuclease signature motif containing protein [Pseudomonas laurylsulfatiphila]UVM07049.1 HNH endonuclease [Pseudomonas laurylsulfatiphila]
MTKLTTLKPRLLEVRASALKAVNPDSWRDGKTKTAERGYGGKWQRERLVFLKANPLCVYCQRESRVEAASVVDHKVPHRGDWSVFWDRKNWQALCKRCHDSTKKVEEAGMGG